MTYRLLLLASYCGDGTACTEQLPCAECLEMCNLFEAKDSTPLSLMRKIGGLDTNRYRSTLSLPKENAK